MSAYENASHFAGKPVEDFQKQSSIDPEQTVYRFRFDWDAPDTVVMEDFQAYMAKPGAEKTTALVFGLLGESPYDDTFAPVVQALVEAAPRLPELEALFLGDIVQEESEISWIQQTDLGPLLTTFPKLRQLRIRGGEGLRLDAPGHPELRSLVIETGGLPGEVVRSIGSGSFPNLEELTLWLGVSEYGASWTQADLAPFYSGSAFPELRSLGLCNSEDQDAIARGIAGGTVLERLQKLDLSLGTLGDEGAEALLACPLLGNLEFLDLHHHYMSEGMIQRFQQLELEVDVSEQEEPDDWGDGEEHRYAEFTE